VKPKRAIVGREGRISVPMPGIEYAVPDVTEDLGALEEHMERTPVDSRYWYLHLMEWHSWMVLRQAQKVVRRLYAYFEEKFSQKRLRIRRIVHAPMLAGNFFPAFLPPLRGLPLVLAVRLCVRE
jgi:hypothetical protein